MRNISRIGVVAAAAALTAAGLGLSSASAGTTQAHSTTLRFTSVQQQALQNGANEVTSGKDVHDGTVSGFDATTCVANIQTHTASCDAAVARMNGVLYGHVVVSLSTGTGSGRVTGGSGAYKGATGTISVAPGSAPGTIRIAITYRT
jgi:hypothetical protein